MAARPPRRRPRSGPGSVWSEASALAPASAGWPGIACRLCPRPVRSGGPGGLVAVDDTPRAGRSQALFGAVRNGVQHVSQGDLAPWALAQADVERALNRIL